jgi:hypothetical protein
MAGVLVMAPTAGSRTAPPADIGAAREALYGSFQIMMWCRGFGTMEEIEADLRAGRLGEPFRQWLNTRRNRRN